VFNLNDELRQAVEELEALERLCIQKALETKFINIGLDKNA
jgi:hypothetical protein